MGKTIEDNLADLRKSFKTLSSLTAWRNLKLAERRGGEPPSFQMYDPTESEIKREVAIFLLTLFNSRAVLAKLPSSKGRKARGELLNLEEQFNRLARTEKLISR